MLPGVRVTRRSSLPSLTDLRVATAQTAAALDEKPQTLASASDLPAVGRSDVDPSCAPPTIKTRWSGASGATAARAAAEPTNPPAWSTRSRKTDCSGPDDGGAQRVERRGATAPDSPVARPRTPATARNATPESAIGAAEPGHAPSDHSAVPAPPESPPDAAAPVSRVPASPGPRKRGRPPKGRKMLRSRSDSDLTARLVVPSAPARSAPASPEALRQSRADFARCDAPLTGDEDDDEEEEADETMVDGSDAGYPTGTPMAEREATTEAFWQRARGGCWTTPIYENGELVRFQGPDFHKGEAPGEILGGKAARAMKAAMKDAMKDIPELDTDGREWPCELFLIGLRAYVAREEAKLRRQRHAQALVDARAEKQAAKNAAKCTEAASRDAKKTPPGSPRPRRSSRTAVQTSADSAEATSKTARQDGGRTRSGKKDEDAEWKEKEAKSLSSAPRSRRGSLRQEDEPAKPSARQSRKTEEDAASWLEKEEKSAGAAPKRRRGSLKEQDETEKPSARQARKTEEDEEKKSAPALAHRRGSLREEEEDEKTEKASARERSPGERRPAGEHSESNLGTNHTLDRPATNPFTTFNLATEIVRVDDQPRPAADDIAAADALMLLADVVTETPRADPLVPVVDMTIVPAEPGLAAVSAVAEASWACMDELVARSRAAAFMQTACRLTAFDAAPPPTETFAAKERMPAIVDWARLSDNGLLGAAPAAHLLLF